MEPHLSEDNNPSSDGHICSLVYQPLLVCCACLREVSSKVFCDSCRISNAIYSFSILCSEHHYCEDQQWRSVKSTMCLCLLMVVLVLVLRIWFCLHHCTSHR